MWFAFNFSSCYFYKQQDVLDIMPAQFNRQLYVAIALSLGITDKSAHRYIKEFVDADILQNGRHDRYINHNATNPHFPTSSFPHFLISPLPQT